MLYNQVDGTDNIYNMHIFYPVLSTGGGVGGKIMSHCLVGEKYDDLLRKSANIHGKRWKFKKNKEIIFTAPRGINIISI